jgi:hypothetical protein
MGTFYIPEPELAYVHVPRTGMAMKEIIESWLKPNFTVIDQHEWMINHPNAPMVRKYYPSAKTLSVVRNPWQRIWSFYRKISQEGYWLDWNNQTLMDLKPLEAWLEDYANPEIVFEFPRWFNRFTNQVDFLEGGVDFVLRAEHLATEFKPVQEYLNCSKTLPDISEYDHYEYRKYFSTRCKDIVSNVFERDINRFGYTF